MGGLALQSGRGGGGKQKQENAWGPGGARAAQIGFLDKRVEEGVPGQGRGGERPISPRTPEFAGVECLKGCNGRNGHDVIFMTTPLEDYSYS